MPPESDCVLIQAALSAEFRRSEYTAADKDFSEEISQIETLKAEQQEKLDAVVEKEKAGMDSVVTMLKSIKVIQFLKNLRIETVKQL